MFFNMNPLGDYFINQSHNPGKLTFVNVLYIVLTGDLNCHLLSNNPRGEALLSFCATVNATQLIDKPTRVTENSRSLLDVILVSDPVLVKSSGVLEITISDHFLVYVVINLRSPKQAPTYLVTRSFRNYKADQFANEIAHIPWDTMNLHSNF